MYGLPDGFDGSFFLDRVLEFVSFSANTLNLDFDNSVSLTIESSYEYKWADDVGAIESQQVPVSSSRLMGLIGGKVLSVGVEDGGTLVLNFDSGTVFRCFDDQSHYESYRIAHGGEEIYI